MAPWEQAALAKPNGSRIQATATRARHGPAGIEPLSGDVIGFVLSLNNHPSVYVTGDTVWYDGVAEVARRLPAEVVLLFAGAAQTRGPFNLTMNTNDAIETARAFPNAVIVPIHTEGWRHFSQGPRDLEISFKALGVGSRLRLPKPGVAMAIDLG